MNSERLNRLRAAVLGANDGIISVATALVAVMGVFGARELMLTAAAVLFAGAISMAAGEYISVSAQVNHELPNSDDESPTSPQAPMQAAIASLLAFLAGGFPPAALALLTENHFIVILSAIILLATSAALTAKKTARIRSSLRLTLVGAAALAVSLGANSILQALEI